MIRTKQRWISEQKERLEQRLEDMQRYRFGPENVEKLRRRLADRLESASSEDRRFVLEVVGNNVIVQADGTWEVELQVPRETPAAEEDLQIVNS